MPRLGNVFTTKSLAYNGQVRPQKCILLQILQLFSGTLGGSSKLKIFSCENHLRHSAVIHWQNSELVTHACKRVSCCLASLLGGRDDRAWYSRSYTSKQKMINPASLWWKCYNWKQVISSETHFWKYETNRWIGA